MAQNEQKCYGRKVLFSFIPATGFVPDEKIQVEQEELARKREGIVHEIKEIEMDESKKTIFIIEDQETKCVYEIGIDCVQFID